MNFFIILSKKPFAFFVIFIFSKICFPIRETHFFRKNSVDKYINIRYPIICINDNAALAQLVERFHGKEEVAGSSPASGFLKQCNMLV